MIYNCCKHAVNINLLDYLFEAGCDPKVINSKKLNAFNACLEWNHKKNNYMVLDWLFSKQCAIEKHYPHLPYLHNMIICHGNSNSLPWISKHYSLNEQDLNGNTALHISVHQDTEHNSPVPCTWLCEQSILKGGIVNVDIQNNTGQTALHLACLNGFSNCIIQLLNAGANTTLQDNNGKTAKDVLLESIIAQQDTSVTRKWPGDLKKSLEYMNQNPDVKIIPRHHGKVVIMCDPDNL